MHELTSFLSKFDIDQEKLFMKVFPVVQEYVIDSIRPTEEQLRKWRNSPNGREEFRVYMTSKFTVPPTPSEVRVLWNIYNGRKQTSRDKKLIRCYIEAQREAVFCAHCGRKDGSFHVDHIVPLSRGGTDELKNLQLLCAQCNLKKSNGYDARKSFI
ncbi:HNH endonuclease signature motif containing protein [Exiguobacterium sp. s133]|uniref:HNH endonuclease n=1 Tax=Exiguobacterium sp. s133 TaxID=2751213 RepID=UPI001BE61EBB|nr:HNH endonuclease signature motif containing protein [Exiguobacterium sp. s133]